MRSIITQNEVFRYSEKADYFGGYYGGGLIGLAFTKLGEAADKAITESRRQEAIASLDPVLAATGDLDFRSEFWDALKLTLDSSSWLKVNKFERAIDYIKVDDKSFIVADHEFEKENFLAMVTIYNFIENMTELVVKTYAVYFIAGSASPVYKGTVWSYSKPMKGKSKAEIISGWAANGAAAYRAALTRGVAENMRMLQIDFLNLRRAGGGMATASTSKSGSPVVERNGDRIIFRKKDGDLMAGPKTLLSIIEPGQK